MKTRKSSSNVYVSPEVLTQILANLPAKSLLRCRCVCKSWCAIIDDPYFVNMHSKLYNSKNKTLNSTELLTLECLNNFGQMGCLLTLRKAGTLRKTGDDIFKTSYERYVVHGSCNSLILISRCLNYLYRGMRICNPSIRKSILIPDCPRFPWYSYEVTYVLGLSSQSKDIKVIAFSFKRIRGVTLLKMCLAVCTLNDRQWVVRDNGFNFDCLSSMHLFGPYYFCDGAAHWLGTAPCENTRTSNKDDKPTHLISLDFDTESFTFLELPQALDEDTTSRYLFLLGESLAFLYISCKRILRIWMLKQESRKMGWTLWLSGPSSVDAFDWFYFRGPTTERVLYCEGDSDGDRGYLVYEEKSYNIATGQVQWLQPVNRYVESEPYCENSVLYCESLMLCKGYRVEDTTTSPIRWVK